MTVKSYVDFGLASLSVGDNTFISQGGSRYAVTTCYIHNPTVGVINVTIYQSPDLTSASGVSLGVISVPVGGAEPVPFILGQGYESGQNLIAVPDQSGAYIKTTGIEFD